MARGIVTPRDVRRRRSRGCRAVLPRSVPGTLAAPRKVMETKDGSIGTDVPTDFIQFLNKRLGLQTQTTLSLLGTFLLDFRPLRRDPLPGHLRRTSGASGAGCADERSNSAA